MLKPIFRCTIYQSESNDSLDTIEPIYGTFQPYALQFYSYNLFELNYSWDQITQTAKIILPRKIKSIGATTYERTDFNLHPEKILPNIINKLITGSEFGVIPMTQKKLPLDEQGTFYSLIFNPNANNGVKYDFRPGDYISPQQAQNGIVSKIISHRVNGLIQHGDFIIINYGYMIENKDGGFTFNTMEFGNLYGTEATNTNGKLSPIKTPITFTASSAVQLHSHLPPNLDYYNSDGSVNLFSARLRVRNFTGYVSKININKDGMIELDCEDYMYLFNKIKVPNAVYAPSNTHNSTNVKYKKAINYFPENGPINGWTLNNIIADMYNNSIGGDPAISNVNYLPISNFLEGSKAQSYIAKKAHDTIRINTNIDTTIGEITLKNATIGDFFKKIKEDYNIPVFFSPNSTFLVTTPFIYNTQLTKPGPKPLDGYTKDPQALGQEEMIFIMGQWSLLSEQIITDYFTAGTISVIPGYLKNRQNILKSNLEYKSTSDVPVGALVKSIYLLDTIAQDGSTVKTKNGVVKKTPQEHTVPVGDQGGTVYTFFYLVTRSSGTNLPATGEKTSNYQNNIFNPNGSINVKLLDAAMKAYGYYQLSHYNYQGFYGTFETYGYPYVRPCDIVNIVDLSFPERSGRYYVKSVKTKGDTESGITQTIEVDYRLPNKTII